MYILIFIAGFIGGIIRGLVGFIKHQFAYKNVPFKLSYFLSMIFISGVIGLLAAIVVKELGITFLGLARFTPALAFVIGYAGGDFIENIVKIVFKKPTLFQLPKHLKQE
jgi:energy-converting hydrogenase Eha subunit A